MAASSTFAEKAFSKAHTLLFEATQNVKDRLATTGCLRVAGVRGAGEGSERSNRVKSLAQLFSESFSVRHKLLKFQWLDVAVVFGLPLARRPGIAPAECVRCGS